MSHPSRVAARVVGGSETDRDRHRDRRVSECLFDFQWERKAFSRHQRAGGRGAAVHTARTGEFGSRRHRSRNELGFLIRFVVVVVVGSLREHCVLARWGRGESTLTVTWDISPKHGPCHVRQDRKEIH